MSRNDLRICNERFVSLIFFCGAGGLKEVIVNWSFERGGYFALFVFIL